MSAVAKTNDVALDKVSVTIQAVRVGNKPMTKLIFTQLPTVSSDSYGLFCRLLDTKKAFLLGHVKLADYVWLAIIEDALWRISPYSIHEGEITNEAMKKILREESPGQVFIGA